MPVVLLPGFSNWHQNQSQYSLVFSVLMWPTNTGSKYRSYFESFYWATCTHIDTSSTPNAAHASFYSLLEKNEEQHIPKIKLQDRRTGEITLWCSTLLTEMLTFKVPSELTLGYFPFMFPVLLDQPEIWGAAQPINPSVESPKLARPFPTGSKLCICSV